MPICLALLTANVRFPFLFTLMIRGIVSSAIPPASNAKTATTIQKLAPILAGTHFVR